MFRVLSSNLLRTRRLLVDARATYIRGYWPEPITQQTLKEFLKDINYFEEPKTFVNIGLDDDRPSSETQPIECGKHSESAAIKEQPAGSSPSLGVDQVLDLLTQDPQVPPLDLRDVRLQGRDLLELAVAHGIYRDLFGAFVEPNRRDVNFTPKQAERMDKLVPHFWLTDQPFARVDRHPKQPDPVYYFVPLVGVTPKFTSDPNPDQPDGYVDVHTSFYGNIIPARDALAKPSITLDGHLLLPFDNDTTELVDGDQLELWPPGRVNLVNFGNNSVKYYSIALVNLDHLHEDKANLHWLLGNLKPSPSPSEVATEYQELCDYLPVHGIQGFGYSRYVFLVFQHDSPLDSERLRIKGKSLDSRKFEAKAFLEQHKSINMKPVGLSWFQTCWDESSNAVFHNDLEMKMPVFEQVQTKLDAVSERSYPGKIPFNIYLDHYRDKKKMNEQVLLERLKTVDPFDYKDQYVPPKVPPTVFEDDANMPSWMTSVMLKKKNKIGIWRGLRPSSAILPLNNNEDLDYPIRPAASSKKMPPEYHNLYPAMKKLRSFKVDPLGKPANEHEANFIQEDHENHLETVRKMMEKYESKKK